MASQRHNAFLFDMDGTLFDRKNSMKEAMVAVQDLFPSIGLLKPEDLAEQYESLCETVPRRFPTLSADAKENRVALQFLNALGIVKENDAECMEKIEKFREAHEKGYKAGRRATEGSIETISRLRDRKYRIGIIANGTKEYHEELATAIEIRHLVDEIVTSEEFGCRKNDVRIFEHACRKVGAGRLPTYLVSTSTEEDMQMGLSLYWPCLWYKPEEKEERLATLHGKNVPVIVDMRNILERFGIRPREFLPRFDMSIGGTVIIDDLGLDLVTEPRQVFRIKKDLVRFLGISIGQILKAVAEELYELAMFRLEAMIRATARLDPEIDTEIFRIVYPRAVPPMRRGGNPVDRRICEEKHSLAIVYWYLVLPCTPENSGVLIDVTNLLHAACEALMKGVPLRAMAWLRHAMLRLARQAGFAIVVDLW